MDSSNNFKSYKNTLIILGIIRDVSILGGSSMTIQKLTQNQKLNFWYNHIQAQLSSGLTVSKYCEIKSLAPSTFYVYERKIKQLLCDEINTQKAASTAVPFVAVPNPIIHNDDKIIITKGNIKIEFGPGTDYQSIESILRTLL